MFDEIESNTKKRMQGAISSFSEELSGLRAGRATPDLLAPVMVDVYGSKFKINQLASISVPEPRMIIVQVWDQTNTDHIAKAIVNSNIGFNPVTEGAVIRIVIPEMSMERRKDMVQVAQKCAEQARVSVRNVRRDSLNKMKQIKSELPEDEYRQHLESLQKITDNIIKEIDQMVSKKQQTILGE